MRVTQKLLSLGKKARPGIKFTKPLDRIVVHWIGPYPNQAVVTPWHWWENGSDGHGITASAHFILKDTDLIQCLPLDEVGWHSGDARNYSSIGIEVIPKNVEGEFSMWSLDTLKKLIWHIRDEVGLKLPVERHYDGVQKKDCPRFYTPLVEGGQDRWEEFLRDVERFSL